MLASTRGGHRGPPTTPRLGRRSPFGALQRPPSRPPPEFVLWFIHVVENAIHRCRDTIRGMPRHVLAQSPRVNLAAWPLRAVSQVLRLRKNVIGDGHGGFHT